jgi:Calcineurin-like phosphoesterase
MSSPMFAPVSLLIIIVVMVILSSTSIIEREGIAIVENHSVYASPSPSSTATLPDFNFAAAGDWGCTDNTTDTVENIIDKNPELVLGLGDYSYGKNVSCWLEKIQPINNLMKIVLGNHDREGDDIELMQHFGLTREYYSFDFQNVHFIALGTESEYLDMSEDKAQEQLVFVKSDLENAASNPNIKWIIPFFHRIMYYDQEGDFEDLVDPPDHNLMDIYHPLFEQYGVNLVLQAHIHTYERTYPLKFNAEDSEDPIITSKDSSNYPNIDGLVIATVGTGGAFPTDLLVDDDIAAVQYDDIFGFLNVDVSADGTTLVGTFYDNDNEGDIKDKFTITKSKSS